MLINYLPFYFNFKTTKISIFDFINIKSSFNGYYAIHDSSYDIQENFNTDYYKINNQLENNRQCGDEDEYMTNTRWKNVVYGLQKRDKLINKIEKILNKLPKEIIEIIYTFYNPHKTNYIMVMNNLYNKFYHMHENHKEIYNKKFLYLYELKISAFGFNIMGSDILKCIFFKRKQLKNENLIEYWINELLQENDNNYFFHPFYIILSDNVAQKFIAKYPKLLSLYIIHKS